jgi:phosphatidylserine/phosphatidylglycerophosphate/cardiolipin synthase-like enzyme
MDKLAIKIGLFVLFLFCIQFGIMLFCRKFIVDQSIIEVYFSPKGGCKEKVIENIGREEREILVSAYSFTNREIGEALVRKGKIVHVVVDRSETSKDMVEYLIGNGIDVVMDRRHGIAHNKVIVGSNWVESGSYNYTNQAEERNAENCIFIRDKWIVEKYRENWKLHHGHSVEVSY